MYIPAFWCGVILTILIEIVLIIIYNLFRKDDEHVRK